MAPRRSQRAKAFEPVPPAGFHDPELVPSLPSRVTTSYGSVFAPISSNDHDRRSRTKHAAPREIEPTTDEHASEDDDSEWIPAARSHVARIPASPSKGKSRSSPKKDAPREMVVDASDSGIEVTSSRQPGMALSGVTRTRVSKGKDKGRDVSNVKVTTTLTELMPPPPVPSAAPRSPRRRAKQPSPVAVQNIALDSIEEPDAGLSSGLEHEMSEHDQDIVDKSTTMHSFFPPRLPRRYSTEEDLYQDATFDSESVRPSVELPQTSGSSRTKQSWLSDAPLLGAKRLQSGERLQTITETDDNNARATRFRQSISRGSAPPEDYRSPRTVLPPRAGSEAPSASRTRGHGTRVESYSQSQSQAQSQPQQDSSDELAPDNRLQALRARPISQRSPKVLRNRARESLSVEPVAVTVHSPPPDRRPVAGARRQVRWDLQDKENLGHGDDSGFESFTMPDPRRRRPPPNTSRTTAATREQDDAVSLFSKFLSGFWARTVALFADTNVTTDQRVENTHTDLSRASQPSLGTAGQAAVDEVEENISQSYSWATETLSAIRRVLSKIDWYETVVPLVLAFFLGLLFYQFIHSDQNDRPDHPRDGTPQFHRPPSYGGAGDSVMLFPTLGGAATAGWSWVAALYSKLPTWQFGSSPTLNNDQFHSIKTQLTDRILSQLEKELPDALHLTKDASGKLQVPMHFWQALRELIKKDDELLTLDVTRSGDVISDKHWAALASRIRENNMAGSSDLALVDVDARLDRKLPPMWDAWLHSNEEAIVKMLAKHDIHAAASNAQVEGQITEAIRKGGLRDVVVTRKEFLHHLEAEFARYRVSLSADLEAVRERVLQLAKQVDSITHPESGISHEEAHRMILAELQKSAGRAQLDKLSAHEIDDFWLGQLSNTVNVFSPGNGAEIDADLVSPSWSGSSSFGGGGRPERAASGMRVSPAVAALPAKEALETVSDVADRWCAGLRREVSMDGTAEYSHVAQLGVITQRWVQPEHLLLEHMPAAQLLDHAASAPRTIEVWAFIDDHHGSNVASSRGQSLRMWSQAMFPRRSTDLSPPSKARGGSGGRSLYNKKAKGGVVVPDETSPFVLIGVFTFDVDDLAKGRKLYAFSEGLQKAGFFTNTIVIRALDNHGADYTCFYRLRLFGAVREENSAKH